ncbi:hypothetical protein N0V82_003362 [Gnomoniopsis sp. IMI 355080]|nr:hypothetical protein N0V82_003362 [Gnomoniopsis sp. IMI 355080]
MGHEEPHVARRSASQGSLSSSYAVSTRTNPTMSNASHHPVPYFKPLRSIRENGHTFLDPAASADGMLRKTTETGNIGLFSINTGRPIALRPRASLGDLRQPHRPFSRSSDRPSVHDDRKRLPSYRDSTSEIISMYGSDNQSSSKSVSGTLSPPWDEPGPRSYSMTTCGSKSYTLPRNNNLRLAPDCQPGAQRPRSPYPYPTRLPRPGIRPSSPALTENGIVDYSRMVEIDRIPQVPRMQVPEKQPPIFYDYSEDFEDAVDPLPDLPIANPTPTRISKAFCPGISDVDFDARSESADEGVGNIVDFLRRVTMIESAEEHDRHDESHGLEQDRSVSELNQTGSSVRASSYKAVEDALASVSIWSDHALGSSGVSTATLEDHEDDVEDSQSHGPNSVADSMKVGLVAEASTVESPMNPENPISDLRIPLAEGGCCEDEGHSCPDQHERSDDPQGNGTLDNIPEQRMDSTGPTQPVDWRPEVTSSASAKLPGRYSSERKDSQVFSLSSGLSDLASFVKYVDKHMQALDPADGEQYGTPLSESRSESGWDRVKRGNQTVQKTPAPPRVSSLAHQRRSYVGHKVNTPAPIDEIERYQVVSTRSGPTLVPQPISPAKMLRVKNSIPQLMKALPPLPGYSPASESPFNPTIVPVEFEPFEFSRLTDARSTLIETFGSDSHDKQPTDSYEPFSFDREVHKPRLKLKNVTPLAAGNVCRFRPSNDSQADAAQSEILERRSSTTGWEYSTAPVKRRLPVKVARPALRSVASEDSGTVKRRPGVDKSSTVSELTSSQPVDLFNTSKVFELAALSAGTYLSELSTSSDKNQVPVSMVGPSVTSKQQGTAVDEGRGVSLDTHLNGLKSPRTKTEVAAEDEMQSFFSDSLIRPHRGLKKKLSNLKSRLIDSRHQHMRCTMNDVVHGDIFNKANPGIESRAPNAIRDLLTEPMGPMKDQHTLIPTRTVRSKLGKLVKGVKYRLRTWGKHKHTDELVNNR